VRRLDKPGRGAKLEEIQGDKENLKKLKKRRGMRAQSAGDIDVKIKEEIRQGSWLGGKELSSHICPVGGV